MINYLKKIWEAIKAFFTKEETTLIEEFRKVEAEAKTKEEKIVEDFNKTFVAIENEVKKISRKKKTDVSK